MKKGWKWKLIGVLTAMLSLCLFAGCQLKETLDDKKNKFDIVAQITYHANKPGEVSIGDTYATQKTLYYTENSPALTPAHTEDLNNVTMGKPYVALNYDNNKYKLVGWYEAERDSEGNVLTEADGTVKLKATPLDLSTLRLQKNDNYTVYAKWELLQVVVVKLVCEEDAVLYSSLASDTKAYRNGDEIRTYAFDANGKRAYPSSFFSVKNSAYTFTEFYSTADVSNPANMLRQDDTASWPLQKAEDGTNTVIYAHYISGNHVVLKTVDGVKNFFRNANKSLSYYLLYDIDCSSIDEVAPLARLNAKLYGNGHTLSNLKVNKTQVTQVGLFGDIGANALLDNVTFTNMTVTYETDGRQDNVQVYWLFTSCASVDVFNGVTFTNVSVAITKKKSTTQITNFTTSNRYYGGVDGGDDAFISAVGDKLTYTTPITVTVDGTQI